MILGTSGKALEQHGATLIASLNILPGPEHVDSRLSLRTGKGQFEIGQTWALRKQLSQAKSLVPGKEISIYRISVKMMWPS